MITQNDLSPADHIDRIARGSADLVTDHIAQSCITLVTFAVRPVSHQVALGQVLNGDDGVGHGWTQLELPPIGVEGFCEIAVT